MAIKSIKIGNSAFDIDYSHCVQTSGNQTISGDKTFEDKASFYSGIYVGPNITWDNIDDERNFPVIYFGDYDESIPLVDQYCAIGEEEEDTLAIVGGSGIHLYSNGGILANTSISAPNFYKSSDERLKNFGEDLEPDFDKIKSIPKKYFEWKDEKKPGLQIGTSAQELQKVYPELVNEGSDGMLSVDYATLSIVALSAIDKLHEEIEVLKNKINELENACK